MKKLPDKIKVGSFFTEDLWTPDNPLLLESKEVEAEDGEKNWVVEGVFAQSNVKNNNGRVYPSDILDKSMNEYMKDKVKMGRAFGELGHPDSPKINLDKVCIIVTDLNKQDANWNGRAKVMHHDCPNGKILRGILRSGGNVGVSTRGLGSANDATFQNEKCSMVGEFVMRAVDVVADPSAPDAYVNAIREEKQYIMDESNEVVCELNEETYKIFEEKLRNMPSKAKVSIQEQRDYLYKGLVEFLNGLKKNP
jgi:hypothetical protein